jgi:hypothetical protein
MLAPKPKTKRLLETIQFALTFASACAVVDASRVDPAPLQRPGYHASVPQPREVARDRTLGDLARIERKRREAEQHSNRHGLELGQALQQRQLRA